MKSLVKPYTKYTVKRFYAERRRMEVQMFKERVELETYLEEQWLNWIFDETYLLEYFHSEK